MKVICMSPPLSDAAAAFAAEAGAAFASAASAEELPRAADDDFLLVAGPGGLDDRLLAVAFQCQRDRGVLFSVLTGLSHAAVLEKLLQWRRDSSLMPESTTLVLRKENKPIATDLPWAVLSRYDATRSNFAERVRLPRGRLSLLLDGSQKHLHLHDGHVCGLGPGAQSDSEPVRAMRSSLPGCFVAGEWGCEPDLIFARDVRAEAVFLNSCSNSLVEGERGAVLNVAMSLFAQAKLVIAGYRPKDGQPDENLLYSLLSQQGYSLGEVVYILNMYSYHQGRDYDPYVGFGFLGAAEPPPAPAPGALSGGLSERGLEVTLQRPGAHYYELDFDCASRPEVLAAVEDRAYHVVPRQAPRQDVFVAVVPYAHRRKVKVLLFSWNRIDSPVSFDVHTDGGALHLLEGFHRRLRSAHKLRGMGFNHKKFTNQLHHYEQQLLNMVGHLQTANGNLNRDRIDKAIRSLEVTERDLTRILVDDLSARKLNFFLDCYAPHTVIRSASHRFHRDLRCPYCGKGLYAKLATNPVLDIQRLSAFCSKCENVYDVPVTEGEVRYPRITWVQAGRDRARFSIRFPREDGVSGKDACYVYVWSESLAAAQRLEVTPGQKFLDLAGPSPTIEVEVGHTAGEAASHDYCLYAYWFRDLELHISSMLFALSS